MLLTLIVALCWCLLILNYWLSGKRLSSPGVVFSGAFAISTVNALTNMKAWGLNQLSSQTALVIVSGLLLFSVGTISIHQVFERKNVSAIQSFDSSSIKILFFRIPKYVFVICIIMQIMTAILAMRAIQAVGTQYGSDGSLSDSIMVYRTAALYLPDFEGLPWYVTALTSISTAVTYLFIYDLVSTYINNHREIKVLALCNVVLGVALPSLYGGRGPSLILVCAMLAVVLMLYEQQHKFRGYNLRFIVWIGVIGLITIVAFQSLLSFMGRSSGDFSPYYYLSIYLGASVKNLDIFISSVYKAPSFDGTETFQAILPLVNQLTGKSAQAEVLPFNMYNGYDLGNVYTTFRAFLHDFGYMGVFILTITMAILSQVTYEVARKRLKKAKGVIPLLLYGITFYSLLTSFFSNQYYSTLFSSTIVQYIIIWQAILVAMRIFGMVRIESITEYKASWSQAEETIPSGLSNHYRVSRFGNG
jgi:oligosaccharide repeat unit polymerase